MKVFESACSANVTAHNEYCNACSFGPCGDPSRAPSLSDSDISELLEYLGVRRFSVDVEDDVVILKLDKEWRSIAEVVRYLVTATTRRRVLLKAT